MLTKVAWVCMSVASVVLIGLVVIAAFRDSQFARNDRVALVGAAVLLFLVAAGAAVADALID